MFLKNRMKKGTENGNGECGMTNQRRTGNGERGMGNGERGTGNGERGKENEERGTNFDMLLLVMGFISLVDEIQYMLISSRHLQKAAFRLSRVGALGPDHVLAHSRSS